MKTIASLIAGIIIVCVVGAVLAHSSSPGKYPVPAAQGSSDLDKTPAKPAKTGAQPARDHKWLKQLVGEWDMTFKMYTQPDQLAAEAKGTDSVRTLGGHWVISEMKTTMMGAPYNGVMSLGHDPAKNQFHGTYIDSFGSVLWVYKGTLNEAGNTLTLETEGPSLAKVGQTAKYKEVIQITGKDTRTFNSSTQTEDGKWMKIVTIEYSRKK